jgi:hypothetical protein
MASDARSRGVDARAREEGVFFTAGVCGEVLLAASSFDAPSSSVAASVVWPSLNSSIPIALA